jgi:hypothetical protein
MSRKNNKKNTNKNKPDDKNNNDSNNDKSDENKKKNEIENEKKNEIENEKKNETDNEEKKDNIDDFEKEENDLFSNENKENEEKYYQSFIFFIDNNLEKDEESKKENNDDDYSQDDNMDNNRCPSDDEFDNYYENNNKKRSRDKNIGNLDFIFNDIINNIKNKKNSKKQKIESSDDFNKYFKESDKLLPIDKKITNLKDLIELGETYNPKDKNRYVINLRALNKCVQPLKELESMIGMNNIKEMIIDLIFFRLQNLEDNKQELWHLVIQGTPGSGKTEVAKIIANLYYSLGIVKKNKFTPVKRSDLIGKYLGHTAKMTQEVFDNAKGGVLFIDEAYSLGNPENRDSFSKECIDTINQNLTENKETVVFIAGYKEQLEESFFSYNPGLNRRFKMRLTVDKYNASDLRKIYIKKLNENNWSIMEDDQDKNIPLKFFEKNISMFKYNGGDMENLWHFTKIVHSRRIFGKPHDLMKKITHEDVENAFKLYSENEEFKSRTDDNIAKYIHNTMYC